MTDRYYKILLVEPDADVLEVLVASLSRRRDVQVTCVSNGNACLDVEMTDPHDLIITEEALADMSGLALADKLMALATRPVVLLTGEADFDDALAALRSGVADIFRRPISIEDLLESTDQLLRDHTMMRLRAAKYHRMRSLVRRVIRERRDLRRRIELVCRDLVGAQRRLVHRVLALGAGQPDST